jgi:Mrp family chromosome partitioning ATPase
MPPDVSSDWRYTVVEDGRRRSGLSGQPVNYPEQPAPEEGPRWREILGIFLAWKRSIVACGVVCAVLALLTAKLLPATYTGEALVLINPVPAGETASNPDDRVAIRAGQEAVPTEVLVLSSTSLAKQTIERLNLDHNSEFAGSVCEERGEAAADIRGGVYNMPTGVKDAWMAAIRAWHQLQCRLSGQSATAIDRPSLDSSGQSDLFPSNSRETATLLAFVRRLKISVPPRSNVIQVSFNSTQQNLAALVPNTLVGLYLDRQTAEKNERIAQESERLDNVILPMLRQKMFQSEADRKIYEHYAALADHAHGRLGHARADANLLSPAYVPLKPTFPNTKIMVFLGLALGLGASAIAAFLFEIWRDRLCTTEQVERALRVKCLDPLPLISPLPKNPIRPRNSVFGQSIRRAELACRTPDGTKNSGVILITSPMPGEGKTLFAVNVAASLAADGLKVVLVDCNFQQPGLHKALGARPAPGLIEYFAGEVELNEIIKSGRNGFRYISAGAAHGPGLGQIGSDQLIEVVDILSKDYAFVILDSASVLMNPETILLSRCVSKIVLVLKWRATPVGAAQHAFRQLVQGAEIIPILSMADFKRAAQYGDTVASSYTRLKRYWRGADTGRAEPLGDERIESLAATAKAHGDDNRIPHDGVRRRQAV